MRRQSPLYVKYPKPAPDRLKGPKPRLGRDVFMGTILAVFFLVLAWACCVFLYGLVSK